VIFITFSMITGLLLLSAFLAGDVSTFINPDSILIVISGTVIYALGVNLGKYRSLLKGLKDVFSFNRNIEKDADTKSICPFRRAGWIWQ